MELCLLTFCYLEWYRAKQLLRTDLGKEQRLLWQRARTWDCERLLQQHLEEQEVELRWSRMQTAAGRQELAKALRAACSATSSTRKAAQDNKQIFTLAIAQVQPARAREAQAGSASEGSTTSLRPLAGASGLCQTFPG